DEARRRSQQRRRAGRPRSQGPLAASCACRRGRSSDARDRSHDAGPIHVIVCAISKASRQMACFGSTAGLFDCHVMALLAQAKGFSMTGINDYIDSEVKGNDVVLFMKGTPGFPQCGFSGQVVQILDYVGVDYKGINVLTSNELRQGIK